MQYVCVEVLSQIMTLSIFFSPRPLFSIFSLLFPLSARIPYYWYAFGVIIVCFLVACPVRCAVHYLTGAAYGKNSIYGLPAAPLTSPLHPPKNDLVILSLSKDLSLLK